MKCMPFVGLVLVVALQAQSAEAQQPNIEQRPPSGCQCEHKFGNDWRPGGNQDVARAAVKVSEFVDNWRDVPDRIEKAASWATFSFGVLVGGVVFLALLTVAQVTFGRAPE